ncbi:GNAT family N-acetyltransferase [Myxococcus sp. CA051A]|uniref:GNAT family N-acetyltransferase n=1 Tax=Myxococcus llanfairpwllgwyngyllgogerychwyrndrobwllllantysiliogogogochensis TaxID=2590453 RepID=A0A540WZC6_9BACT|nr:MULTISPECIES: GNAT family N-acetyltransferase [Myxococcus]NTX05799.1 GNAT family N-acetyltransferase [Myxococcus sp. CA040A]NTX10421.1 GNAT family N-acetyltransferase [Myxococcus sp. CA056]NTX38058.1 GNAT family N-acetyltransferase [Myxococcus sp. CA033]NTX50863.1 GNAT family N-acetyltransferase [Myxococcus sp. CA039A]NTX63213.1 GNAT family N-acetyltransferase [Myxococcus sp. CA051A]
MSIRDLVGRAVIREARPEDDVAVGDLLIEAFTSQYAKKLPDVVYTDERKRELRDVAARRKIATLLVAEVEGEIVGTVALFPPDAPGSEAWLPRAVDLRGLATAVKFHGSGLAQLLLDSAEAMARRWDVDAVCLHVRRGATGVVRMYMARGYLREPSGDLDLPSVYLEAYVMRFKETTH